MKYRKLHPKTKVKILFEHIEQQVPVAALCNKYQISQSVIAYWLKELESKAYKVFESANDQLDFRGHHEFSWHFHFHPKISLRQIEGGLIAESDKGRSLRIDFECVHKLNIDIMECYISRSYGVKKRAKKLKVTARADTSFEMKTCIAVLSKSPTAEGEGAEPIVKP